MNDDWNYSLWSGIANIGIFVKQLANIFFGLKIYCKEEGGSIE